MRLKQTEEEVLKLLWRCGMATKKMVDDQFQLHGPRLRTLVKEEYISLSRDVLYLGDVGEEHCRIHLRLVHRYRTNLRQLEHDLKLARGYLQLPPEVRDTWLTEMDLYHRYKDDPLFKELRDRIQEEGKQFVAVNDAAIYLKAYGGYVGFEALTRNYKMHSIEQKRQFAELFLKGFHTF